MALAVGGGVVVLFLDGLATRGHAEEATQWIP
jgi:hypothetical protein